MAQPSSSSTTAASGKSTRRFWLTSTFIAAGAGAFGLRRWGMLKSEDAAAELHGLEADAATRRADAEAEAQEKRLRYMLSSQARNELDAAEQKDAALCRRSSADLKARIEDLEKEAASFIPAIASQMGSIQGAYWCILLMARDKVTGSAELQKMLTNTLVPINSALSRMNVGGEAALASVAQGLSQHSNQMAASLLTAISQARQQHGEALPGLARTLQPALASIQSGQFNLTLAGTLLPLELPAIWSLARLLGRILANWVGRAAATGSASLGMIAADGPLPFGEVLALLTTLGFTAWSLWDIYHLCKRLPDEIAGSLHSAIATHRDQVLAGVETATTRLRKDAAENRRTALLPILAQN